MIHNNTPFYDACALYVHRFTCIIVTDTLHHYNLLYKFSNKYCYKTADGYRVIHVSCTMVHC